MVPGGCGPCVGARGPGVQLGAGREQTRGIGAAPCGEGPRKGGRGVGRDEPTQRAALAHTAAPRATPRGQKDTCPRRRRPWGCSIPPSCPVVTFRHKMGTELLERLWTNPCADETEARRGAAHPGPTARAASGRGPALAATALQATALTGHGSAGHVFSLTSPCSPTRVLYPQNFQKCLEDPGLFKYFSWTSELLPPSLPRP